MKTIQDQFKDFSSQLIDLEDGGDKYFTGDISQVLEFLKDHENFTFKVMEYSEEYVVLHSYDDSYWGSGPNMEEAQRFLVAAYLEDDSE